MAFMIYVFTWLTYKFWLQWGLRNVSLQGSSIILLALEDELENNEALFNKALRCLSVH
jgi:hypothetical protein